LTLAVTRDEFVQGSPENDWPGALTEFSSVVRDHLGDAGGLVVADFSTTGPVERAASEVVLLDAIQAFFSYEVHTLCGIPSVTLEGTAEDWRRVAGRAREFARFGLERWVESLGPILDEFVAAVEGRVDRHFWDCVYKWHGRWGSGSPHVSGWVVKLFPYLDNPEAKHARMFDETSSAPPLHPNPWLATASPGRGPGRDDFPGLPSKAPFLWKYLGRAYEMEFVGGLMGIQQDPQDLSLRPEIGWAVRKARPAGAATGYERAACRPFHQRF
jgi:hypothetical protein